MLAGSSHVAIDDASRLAYIEVLRDERKASAIAFLDRALAWFRALDVEAARIMTDNGSPTAPKRSPRLVAGTGLGTCSRGPTRRAPQM